MKRLLMILSLVVVVMIGAFVVNSFNNTIAPTEQVIVTVEKGDTLWKYAKLYHPKGMDPRDYIYAIYDANSYTHTWTLHVGDQVILPIYTNKYFQKGVDRWKQQD